MAMTFWHGFIKLSSILLTTILQSNRRWSPPLFISRMSSVGEEFGPSEFEDCTEALFKLRQIGTLKDYILEFCKLAKRTIDVEYILLKICFIGGLKRELKYDVKLLKLSIVHDAIDIAVQFDTKLALISNHLSIGLQPLLNLDQYITLSYRCLECLIALQETKSSKSAEEKKKGVNVGSMRRNMLEITSMFISSF